MKLFDIFRSKAEKDTAGNHRKANDIRELEIYSGMRVLVESFEGELLFIAKLQDPQRNMAELYQYSETEVFQSMDAEAPQKITSVPVRIRGYNDRRRKAVFMEGLITPKLKHVWKIEDLSITKIENERSYPRLNTDMDATVMIFDGANAGERVCNILNISAGGASIGSEHRYCKGEKFFLKTKLLGDKPDFIVYCEVLRVMQKDMSGFEYGCRFLELTEANQEQIAQHIAQAGSMNESNSDIEK